MNELDDLKESNKQLKKQLETSQQKRKLLLENESLKAQINPINKEIILGIMIVTILALLLIVGVTSFGKNFAGGIFVLVLIFIAWRSQK